MTNPSSNPEERDSVPPELARLFATLSEPGACVPHDEQGSRATIKAVLDQALAGGAPNGARVRVKSPSRKFKPVWLVAAFVFAGGGVLAAVGRQYWAQERSDEQRHTGQAGAEAHAAEPRSVPAGSVSERETLPVSPTFEHAPPTLAPEQPVAPSELSAPSATHTSDAKSSTLTNRSGPDLLAEANRLRRRGEVAQAVRVYLRVAEQAPSSQSAYVARVAAGQLLVSSSPKQALLLFRQAHKGRPNGPLEREIRQGIEQATKGER